MAENNNTTNDDFADYTIIDSDVPYREYAPPIQPGGNAQQVPPVRGEMMQPPSVNFMPVPPQMPPRSPFLPPQSYPMVPYTPKPPHRSSLKKWVYAAAGILGATLVILLASSSLYIYLQHNSTQQNSAVDTHTRPTTVPTAPPASNATYRNTACPFSPAAGIVEGKDVTCGYLTVPENRDHPAGKTIDLAVAIFKGADRTPDANVPDFYLTGGPGGGVLSDFGPYITSSNLKTITLNHDLIMLDQRGTGYSRPALDCQEFSDLDNRTMNQSLAKTQENTLYVQAAQQCHDRLVQSGIDLNGYTTIANATDVHDLIRALRYKQVNLYGVSYGTRLALTVMRLFPGDIRSVILDSTVPTQSNLFTALPAVTQHAFNVLFHGCAIDTHCHAAYPQVEAVFYQLVTRLNAHPISFQDAKYGTVKLDGNGLSDWLFSALYITRLIPLLPEVIMQINDGNYKLISQYYSYVLFSGGISQGMYYSVECGEDLAFVTRPDLVQAANVARPEIRAGLLADMQDSYDVCKIWGQQPVPLAQKQPVTSSLPTLILSGEYDPITPYSNAEMAKHTLSNSFLYLFPATGHGVFYTASCPDTIMLNFLNNPALQPNATCISLMSAPAFQ